MAIYDLFVSYAPSDRAWVEGYLLDAFDKAGVQYHSEAAFALGAPRLLEFERAVQESQRTLLVLTPAYLADGFTQFTELLGQAYGVETATWPVIPLVLQTVKLPLHLAILNHLDATDPASWSVVIERLCESLQHPAPRLTPRPPCPYPGMIPFGEMDSERFFGRDHEIQELLRLLRIHPFLTVIGPSGSGKSSLVLAGLVPALRKSSFFGAGTWLVRRFRPGENPLSALATALESDLTSLSTTVSAILKSVPDGQHLLVIVDQFEETFTLPTGDTLPFQRALLQLAQTPHCYIVLTVRADFYPELMTTPVWPSIQAHRMEVAPLNEDGLREAIVRPANDVGVFVEPALVERLVADAAGEPGVLPLVQETLVLLWERLERRLLPLKAYEDLVIQGRAESALSGTEYTGLQVAIAGRADAALYGLAEIQQVIARRIFLRLVQFGEGRADTRRQQRAVDLRSVGAEPPVFEQTLHHLVDSRLLTLSGEEGEAGRKVDIAHEALITGWPTLVNWLTERREAEQIRRRLETKAFEWVRLGCGSGGLLDPAELPEAERWLDDPDADDLGYDENLPTLVQVSRAAILEAEQAKELARQQALEQAQALARMQQQRAEEQTRAAQRLRQFVSVLVMVLLVTLVTALMAWYQANLAAANEETAQLNAAEAQTARAAADRNAQTAVAEEARALRNANLAATNAARAEENARDALTAQNSANQSAEQAEANAAAARAAEATAVAERATAQAAQVSANLSAREAQTAQAVALDKAAEANAAAAREARERTNAERARLAEANSAATALAAQATSVVEAQRAATQEALARSEAQHAATQEALARSEAQRAATQEAHARANANLAATNAANAERSAAEARAAQVRADQNAQQAQASAAEARAAQVRADQNAQQAQAAAATARAAEATAVAERAIAQAAGATAIAERNRANQEANIALARQLAAQAWVDLDSQPQRNLLLALESIAMMQKEGVLNEAAAEMLLHDLLSATGGRVLGYHPDPVSAVAISVDAHWLATASEQTVRLWNLDTPSTAPIFLPEHPRRVNGLAFSPDGLTLATVSDDRDVRLWDLRADGSVVGLRLLHGHTDRVLRVAFSPDAKNPYLASGSIDGSIRLWSLAANDPSASPRILKIDAFIQALAFSSDGKRLVGADGGTVRIWNMNFTDQNSPIVLEHGWARAVAIKAYKQKEEEQWIVAAGSAQGIITLWDSTDDYSTSRQLRGHTAPTTALAFSKDGGWLISASQDHTSRLWDADDFLIPPIVLRGHEGTINDVALSNDGRKLATVSNDKMVRLWVLPGSVADPMNLRDTDKSAALRLWPMSRNALLAPTTISKPNEETYPQGTFVSLNGRWLASRNPGDFATTIWLRNTIDLSASPIKLEPNRGDGAIWAGPVFSPDSQWLAIGTTTGRIIMWQLTENGPLPSPKAWKGHNAQVRDLAFSKDSHRLVTGGNDRLARVWDLTAADPVKTSIDLEGDGAIRTVAISPNGQWVATGSWGQNPDDTTDGHVGILWDLSNSQARRAFEHRFKDRLFDVAFSSDGRWMAAGSWDFTIQLVDLTKPPFKGIELAGHQARVLSLAFSPNSRWLASGNEDRTVRLWNLSSSNIATDPIILHGSYGVGNVAFSTDGQWLATEQMEVGSQPFYPDGQWIATGSAEAHLYPLGLKSLVEVACYTVGRNLTIEEWKQHLGNQPYRKICLNVPDP